MLHLQGHPLAIDQLTTLGATPEEMVETAAALGVGLIGPISSPPGGWVPDCFDLRPGTADPGFRTPAGAGEQGIGGLWLWLLVL